MANVVEELRSARVAREVGQASVAMRSGLPLLTVRRVETDVGYYSHRLVMNLAEYAAALGYALRLVLVAEPEGGAGGRGDVAAAAVSEVVVWLHTDRLEREVSQEEVCAESGLSQAVVSRLETNTGYFSHSLLRHLAAYAGALGYVLRLTLVTDADDVAMVCPEPVPVGGA
ncbi:helix-turn-helix transcriptional regulator [Amycolatopsis sp. NPDC089917]|uniref:helix-turn-helix transcriptional regulator n=1 Tax=Amycolatopsis sp. NPDC089917 TaxID=3155187 RepID=UPI0034397179